MRRIVLACLAVLAVSTLATSICLAQGPLNDACLNAQNTSIPNTLSWHNIGATFEASNGACVSIGADVWFRFTAPWSGTAVASTCPLLTNGSANFDTVITIRPNFCGYSNTPLCCSDDHFNCALSSHCTAQVTIGTAYLIQVGGYNGAQGSFNLYVDVVPSVTSNDHCSGAIPVVVNSPVYTETFAATASLGYPQPCGTAWQDVWFSFVAPSSGQFTASTCWVPTLTMDTVATVYQGSCGALTPLACSNDGCGGSSFGSLVTWCATAGTTYYVLVGSEYSNAGTFSLIISPSSNPAMTLQFFHSGPGSVGYTLKNGPVGGTEFTAITSTGGAYPNGWFWGISPPVSEVVSQWLTGFPFSAPLATACGTVTVGPFFGLPPGLPLYAVSLGFAAGSPEQPVTFSNPASTTIP